MNPTKLTKEELFSKKLASNVLNRAKQTIDFIDEIKRPVCDCGENNPLKQMIEKEKRTKIVSLSFDFDRVNFPAYKWNTILCFEVLEHLYNPLFFLENLKNSLHKGGIIYLSTPYQFPQFLKARHHYHEIPTDRLMWLFDEAGLRIIKKDKITIAGNWYNHIRGFRPFLRYFQKTRIYKLEIK